MKKRLLAMLAVQAALAGACSAPKVSAVSAENETRPAVQGFSAQDYIDVQQLYARYAHAIDTGERDGAAWAETFIPDGVFSKTTVGHDALATFAKNWHENRGGAQIQHWNTQLLIIPTTGGARGSTYLMLVDRRTQPPSIMSVNKYEDELVRTGGGWRFKSRSFVPAPAATQ
jgi:hypothetical protein